jgi:hypothetical protein
VNLNLSRMAFDRMYGQEPVMPAIGVMLPLWRGGIRARIQEAELRATQRELETADARLQLEAEVEDVLAQLARVRRQDRGLREHAAAAGAADARRQPGRLPGRHHAVPRAARCTAHGARRRARPGHDTRPRGGTRRAAGCDSDTENVR